MSEAKSWLSEVEIEAKIAQRQGGECDNSKVTMKQLYDLTLAERWCHLKTTDRPDRASKIINEYIGWDTKASDITPEFISNMTAYLVEQGDSYATINRKKAALSVMFTTGREFGLIDMKPMFRITRENNERIRYLTIEEENKVLDTALELYGIEYYNLIVFLLDTGARLKEALYTRKSDISNRKVMFADTKNHKPRVVPLSARIMKYVNSLCNANSDYIFNSYANRDTKHLYQKIERVLRIARIDNTNGNVVYHTMRHTCATRLAEAGVDVLVIKEWLGHETIQTTLRYVKFNTNKLQDALDKLENLQAVFA